MNDAAIAKTVLLSARHCFSEYRIVVKLNVPADPLVGRIDDAGIKGTRINVKRHGTLIRLARIHYPVYGLPWIDRAGMFCR